MPPAAPAPPGTPSCLSAALPAWRRYLASPSPSGTPSGGDPLRPLRCDAPAPRGSRAGAEASAAGRPAPLSRPRLRPLARRCNFCLERRGVDLLALQEAECFTANGADYRGTQNWTALQGGKPCLFWNETFQHPYNTLKYPNGEGGLGEHNYCRNPDGDVSPWCYVAEHEDGVYWKYCEIPACQMPGNLGCYKDHGNPPPLTGASKTSNKLTIQTCISFCRSQRFKFAGMESGYACFCGNNPDYWKYGEAASTECNSVCFGDHTQPCGGDGRIILFDTVKEEPLQEKPTANQTLAEVITEQANLSVSAARSSKVLYVITTSPSHPPQTIPGRWTVYGLATLLILTVTAIVAKILLHITFKSHRVPASGDLRDCHQPGTSGEIWSIFYKPSTSISIFKKKLKGQSQQDDRNPLVSD
uniref:kremen protein 1 isoform X5 n=1 Tax=Nyctereutes procyonoides TaxID=34880 RepID=UPI00244401F7|nr:kremen protein 1 isoform X5 [Nyctereutes procyonoides]